MLATPLFIYTALRTIQGKSNNVADWLPVTYVETDELNWFREHFVADQFVVLGWDGCRLGGDPRRADAQPDDARIERLARFLVPDNLPIAGEQRNLTTTDASTESANRYFSSVTTGRRVLNQLTSGPNGIQYAVAANRLQGSLIGTDGRQTCVIVTLTDEAVENLRDVVGRGTRGWLRVPHAEGALLAALRACDIDPDTVHLGGPPVDSVAIDEEGESTLYRLALLAALVGLSLAWWSLRSIRLTLIVFYCGLLSAIASLSAVWLTGGTADAFLLSMPSLVYVLAISGAVHLIKYYRDAIRECGLTGAPGRAIAYGWKPTLLCSVTTAIGLLALCTSDLTPVKKFGIYSSLGVMLMLVTLFVFLPAALQLWPVRSAVTGINADSGKVQTSNADRDFLWLDRFWQRFGSWIIQRYVWVTIVCMTIIAGVGWGVTRVQTNIDLMKLFDSQARIRQDYQWLESNVGRLVPLEIVLKFNAQSLRRNDESEIDWQRYDLLERVETVASVQRAIDSRFGHRGEDLTGRPMSALTFVPPFRKTRKNSSEYIRRSITNSRLEESYDLLCESGYLKIDPESGDELWRISVRVAAFKDVDYGEFTNHLRQVVDPVVQRHNRELTVALESLTPDQTNANRHDEPLVSVVYTGVIPIVYKAQRALLDSLMESTFWSFVTITPLLMIVSRGLLPGAAAMLPNTLPVLVVFGGMGWLGVSVTIGSMMSASIALGVAVDDTIHYLMWFREELDRTDDRRKASLTAYRRCATPTLQAALISGFGLSVFAFSTFTPTRQFGLLMLTILLAGVVAELVLLPALLAGPLGRAFQPRRRIGSDNKPEP